VDSRFKDMAIKGMRSKSVSVPYLVGGDLDSNLDDFEDIIQCEKGTEAAEVIDDSSLEDTRKGKRKGEKSRKKDSILGRSSKGTAENSFKVGIGEQELSLSRLSLSTPPLELLSYR